MEEIRIMLYVKRPSHGEASSMPGALSEAQTHAIGVDFEMLDMDQSEERHYCIAV